MREYLFGTRAIEAPEYVLIGLILIVGVAASVRGVRDAVINRFNAIAAELTN